MQKFILLLVITLSTQLLQAQEDFANRIIELAKEIKEVKKEEKEALKEEIEEINQRLENNEIKEEEANQLKEKAAKRSAERIEERVDAIEDAIEDLVEETMEGGFDDEEGEDKKDGEDKEDEEEKVYDEETGDLKINLKPKKGKKMKGEPRTTSQGVFSIGLNTLIEDKELSTIDNDMFQLSNARFYEFGFSYKTRVFAKSNCLHLKYGLSLRVNNVRPNDNQYFVKNGDATFLAADTREYSKDAYFRTAQWVVPIYFEFDFTKPKRQDDVLKFKSQKTFRFGLGGFAGVNSKSRQILHYTRDKIKYEESAKGNYNVSNFVYGLGAYVGYKDLSVYTKLDMNDLFGGESVAYNNLSLGLRWDFH